MQRQAVNTALAALSGIVAVIGGVAVGEIAAAAVSPLSAPFQSVAAALVDTSPAPLREWAIDTFGTSDKLALRIGIGVAMVVIAALAGILQSRRPHLGAAICIVFGAVGVIAAVTRPTAGPTFAIPSILAGIASAALVVWLCRALGSRAAADTDDTPAASAGWSRRRFLTVSGLVVAASAGVTVVARQLAAAGGVVAERAGLKLPIPASPAQPIPAGVQLDIPGATSFLTDNRAFYRIDTALIVPRLTTKDWSLRIHGMVDREITLDWDDLMAIPAQERIVTLTCVSNEVGGDLIGTARWIGFPMRDLLARAGIQGDADMLLSTSVDGWTSGTPLEAINDGRDAMLAVGMNGEPLPLEHGYPVRQVIPGLYGYVSACKWVTDWEITRFDRARAYWTDRGWGEKGPIKTASRIDRPAPLSTHDVGKPVTIAGTAWAQHRGIRAVEVRIDDGPWEPATLANQYSLDTWRQWSYTWQPTSAGNHTVYCRATDANGIVQTSERVPTVPDGATGWHSRVLRTAA
ncbi:molybdopterin-dependent oxidoreductase [Gordonia soli]|uniref:Putative sulfite oxidase n=1 Tax=Gordonia soli NBRC 108243 TaxID=1223545 RepID=M0QLR3_9ACTN|nr:molybdopterin-dependent oxidoreductase [Gordonia soli]GAC69246.1 putative sulfite oxidase [Gordonia soli NBRC 108243]